MTSDRWQHIRAIFEACLELEPNRRSAFLDERCAGDPECREEVERLVRASEDETPFLEDTIWRQSMTALEHISEHAWIGSRIGAYKVTGKLGQGGMGTVYLAERADGYFDRQVAIKLVEMAVYRKDLVQRFDAERRILASLQHPNIARLLDGGVTEAGIPYLVLEYIRGRTFVDHCDTNRLPISERLALFRTICDAVHYAHQNLIIHRDLKPSNVLVSHTGEEDSPKGLIKLLDFGVATLLKAAVEGVPEEALEREHPITLAYASPEQVQGSSVTTASDVYSLGVMLFELLTGRRPYDVAGLVARDIEQVVLTEEIPRPSESFRHGDGNDEELVLARAEQRRDTPDGLRRRIQGDLDTIVLKALSRDAASRYVSVAQFSEDVQRHLDHLPVFARPSSVKYRTGKFVRRHRVGVSLSIATLLVLLASVVITTHQAQVAERNASQVRRLANSLLFEMNDKVRDLPGATDIRRTLVTHALSYLENLSQETGPDPALQLELAEAYSQAGRIQGDPHYTNLGDLQGARTSYQRAVHLREAMWDADSTQTPHRVGLANGYGRLAVVTSWCCDNKKAMRLSGRAIQLLSPALEADPENIGFRHDMARVRSELGWWMIWEGQIADGLKLLEGATSELEYVSGNLPNLLDARHHLWRAYSYQVDGLKFSGHSQEALRILEYKALPLLLSALNRYPDHPLFLYDLHVTYQFLGELQVQEGEPELSLSSYSRSLEIASDLVRSDSTNRKALEAVADGNRSLGRALAEAGQQGQALEHMRRAVDIRQRLFASDRRNLEMGNAAGNASRALCRVLLDLGRTDEALEYCQTSAEVLYEIVTTSPVGLIVAANYASSCAFSARAYRALLDEETRPARRERLREDALLWYRRSLSVLTKLGDGETDLVWEVPRAEVVSEMAELLQQPSP